MKYLINADVYGYRSNGKYIAGFILKPYISQWSNMRVFEQLSLEDYEYIIDKLYEKHPTLLKRWKCCEYTGYFIDKKAPGFLFTLLMILVVFKSGKYFYLSFDRSNKKLAAYYSHGNPTLIYRGPVDYEVVDDNGVQKITHGDEQIECLTRWGILKIFLWRTKKGIAKWTHRQFTRIF
jgi:hypothetical protein